MLCHPHAQKTGKGKKAAILGSCFKKQEESEPHVRNRILPAFLCAFTLITRPHVICTLSFCQSSMISYL